MKTHDKNHSSSWSIALVVALAIELVLGLVAMFAVRPVAAEPTLALNRHRAGQRQACTSLHAARRALH